MTRNDDIKFLHSYTNSSGRTVRVYSRPERIPTTYEVRTDLNREHEKFVHLSRFFRLSKIPQELLKVLAQHTELTRTETSFYVFESAFELVC